MQPGLRVVYTLPVRMSACAANTAGLRGPASKQGRVVHTTQKSPGFPRATVPDITHGLHATHCPAH